MAIKYTQGGFLKQEELRTHRPLILQTPPSIPVAISLPLSVCEVP